VTTRRTRRNFDLEAAARRLFLAAQAKNDFSGAAACLRLLRDLRPSEDAPKPKDEWVPLATEDEFQELSGLLDAIDALESRVKQRLHLEPPPARIAPSIQGEAIAAYAVTCASGFQESRMIGAHDPDVIDALEDGEIDVTDLIEDGMDLSWIPEDDTNAS
jgi:hypothetical protein